MFCNSAVESQAVASFKSEKCFIRKAYYSRTFFKNGSLSDNDTTEWCLDVYTFVFFSRRYFTTETH